jgi:DeoR/GlpR family transcriptional regulator of sugar metabolism
MHQRQKKILDMLQSGKVMIPQAAAELGVTQMTCDGI